MKLIINIPEEKYLFAKQLADGGKENNPLVLAIGNGVPIPKGHGEIIDINEIRAAEIDDWDTARYEKGTETELRIDAPAIIEADEDGGECKYPLLYRVKQVREKIEGEASYWSGFGKISTPRVNASRNARAQAFEYCLKLLNEVIEESEK
jgi:hypothetical protein